MKKILKTLLRFTFFAVLFFFISSTFVVLLYMVLNPPITPLMVMRCSNQLFAGEKIVLKKKWVPIEKISRDLQLSAVVSEDFKFLEHHGFDFEAITKAREFNAKLLLTTVSSNSP